MREFIQLLLKGYFMAENGIKSSEKKNERKRDLTDDRNFRY